MTINKNFVVRNGLEVAQTLLCANDETNRVGINSANPEFELDLYGDLRIVGGLSVGGTTGRAGEYLESTGDALEWKAIPRLRVVETYTAVSGQVTFPSTGFLPYSEADFIDVFVDGVKLAQDEFLTSTGNTRIELVAPALAGETIELVAYNASSIGIGGSGIQGITIGEEGVVVGTAGQVTSLNFVGASLTAIGSGAGVTVYFDNVIPEIVTYASFSGVATYASSSGIASALTSTASVNTTGIITASKFVGDGSGLTNISGGTSSQWETTAAGIHTLSNVGIGTTNPTVRLQIDGVLGFGTFLASGISATNIKIGNENTATSLTTGHSNVFMGSGVGKYTTEGTYNNFLGAYAGYYNTTGSQNNFFGDNAGFYSTSAQRNNFIGSGAGYQNTIGSYNNFIGYYAAELNTTGDYSNIIGAFAGHYNTTGTRNNFFGTEAGIYNTIGNNNIFFGNSTGLSTSASNKVIIGSGWQWSPTGLFDAPDTTKDTQFAVGVRTDANPSKYWLVGNENFNVGIGTTNPTEKLTVRNGDISVGIDTSTGLILTSPNGTRYRLIVDDSGNLSTTSV